MGLLRPGHGFLSRQPRVRRGRTHAADAGRDRQQVRDRRPGSPVPGDGHPDGQRRGDADGQQPAGGRHLQRHQRKRRLPVAGGFADRRLQRVVLRHGQGWDRRRDHRDHGFRAGKRAAGARHPGRERHRCDAIQRQLAGFRRRHGLPAGRGHERAVPTHDGPAHGDPGRRRSGDRDRQCGCHGRLRRRAAGGSGCRHGDHLHRQRVDERHMAHERRFGRLYGAGRRVGRNSAVLSLDECQWLRQVGQFRPVGFGRYHPGLSRQCRQSDLPVRHRLGHGHSLGRREHELEQFRHSGGPEHGRLHHRVVRQLGQLPVRCGQRHVRFARNPVAMGGERRKLDG